MSQTAQPQNKTSSTPTAKSLAEKVEVIRKEIDEKTFLAHFSIVELEVMLESMQLCCDALKAHVLQLKEQSVTTSPVASINFEERNYGCYAFALPIDIQLSNGLAGFMVKIGKVGIRGYGNRQADYRVAIKNGSKFGDKVNMVMPKSILTPSNLRKVQKKNPDCKFLFLFSLSEAARSDENIKKMEEFCMVVNLSFLM